MIKINLLRYFIFTYFLIVFTSCASLEKNNIGSAYFEAFENLKGYFLGYKNVDITEQLIEEIPYASAILTIGRGKPGLLILESINSETQTWVSYDGVFLLLEKGRIIQTQGLYNNLRRLTFSKDVLKMNLDENTSWNIYYSFDSPVLNNLKVVSTFKKLEKKEIELFNQTLVLTLIEETIINSYLGWNVKNYYWVDDDNFVWKSIQNISPKLPPFNLEVTKKPAG